VKGKFQISNFKLQRGKAGRTIFETLLITSLVDTFGAPFTYESKTGWVKSSTKGYESW